MLQKLLSMMELTDADREALKSKRGFTDKTINHFNLKSPVSPGMSIEIVDKMGGSILRRAGLAVKMNLIPSLTTTGLIPYMSGKKVLQIKGHKYGLPGKCPEVFMALKGDTSTIYICESEYKAMAMWQLGYSAMGLAGISTFSGTHFSKLLTALAPHKDKKFIVVFDNDDKESPDSSKYSATPSGRYDAFKYQWYLSYMCGKEGFDIRIANLPNSWRTDGACDIDGCLAEGRTRRQFESAIGEAMAVSPADFKQSWTGTGEMDGILNSWAASKLATPPVSISNNCMYVEKETRTGGMTPKKVADFNMRITTLYKTVDESGIECISDRMVEVVNEFGAKFPPCKISSKELASKPAFAQWCIQHPASVVFSGDGDDLVKIVQYINMSSTPDEIVMINTYGWNEGLGAHIFSDASYLDGKRIEAIEGVSYLSNRGTQVLSPYSSGDAPFEISISTSNFDWRESIDIMAENYGDNIVRIPIVWCLASLMDHVFCQVTQPKMFPLLWVTGAMGSGKNTLISHCLAYIGMNNFEGFAYNQLTEASLWRTLSYYSSLPLWVDELRGDTRSEMSGVWRSIYNKTSTSKSKMNTDKDIITSKVRSSVILSGQDIDSDAALNQRLIPIKVMSSKRKGHKYRWINGNMSEFSAAAHHVLTNYDAIKDSIFKNFDAHRSRWKNLCDNDRCAGNVAVISVMAEAMGIELDSNKNGGFSMMKWVSDMGKSIADSSDDAQFLNDLCIILKSQPELGPQLLKMSTNGDIFIAVAEAYNQWAIHCRRTGGRLMSKPAVIDEMNNHGVVRKESTIKVENAAGARVPVRGLTLRREKVPEELVSLVILSDRGSAFTGIK